MNWDLVTGIVVILTFSEVFSKRKVYAFILSFFVSIMFFIFVVLLEPTPENFGRWGFILILFGISFVFYKRKIKTKKTSK